VMTGDAHTNPTIGDVFFGELPGGGLEEALRVSDAMKRAVDALERVPKPLAHVALDRVAEVLSGVLRVDLVDVLVGGWTKYQALEAAARTSVEHPEEEQVVELATHQIVSTHEPSVEIDLDGHHVGSIGVKIELSATIHALVAIVSGGRLTALRSGRVDLKGELSCEGIEISSVSRQLDPSLELDIGGGIRLIREDYVTIPDPPTPVGGG
jgi:hypothetical protein